MAAESPLPVPMDIYLIDADLNFCKDKRYCLVLDHPHEGKVPVLYISAQLDLCNPREDFFISSAHPDFKATGLKKDSYVMSRVIDEPLSKFGMRARRGKMTAEILIEFEKWFGWK